MHVWLHIFPNRSPARLAYGSDARVIPRQVLEHVRQQVGGQRLPGMAGHLLLSVHTQRYLLCACSARLLLSLGRDEHLDDFSLF